MTKWGLLGTGPAPGTVGLSGSQPPILAPYLPRPLACDVRPVVYEKVSRDHGLVSGQHHLLQKVGAEVLLNPGILQSEQAEGRRECCQDCTQVESFSNGQAFSRTKGQARETRLSHWQQRKWTVSTRV